MSVYEGRYYCLLFLTQEEERVCTDNLILKQTELQTYTNLPCLKAAHSLCSKLPRNLYRFCLQCPWRGIILQWIQALWQKGMTQIRTDNGDRCWHASLSWACSFKAKKSTVWAAIAPREVPWVCHKRWVLFLQNPNRMLPFINFCINDRIIE